MTLKFDLHEMLKDKAKENLLRKKTERHLTQDDIRTILRDQHPTGEPKDGERHSSN